MEVIHLDTFTGVAGFTIALKNVVGENKVKTIWFSEIDETPNKILKSRFENVKNFWDITKIDIENLPYFNLLTGGFPCQDVSVSGKQTLGGVELY